MVEIYQIKVWIKKISPMIYRRILIPDTFSLADLHNTLQIIFGWPDTYLHQFNIYGKRYGISKPGGMWFSDDPKEVLIKHFDFRLKERFLYGVLAQRPEKGHSRVMRFSQVGFL